MDIAANTEKYENLSTSAVTVFLTRSPWSRFLRASPLPFGASEEDVSDDS